MKIRGQLTDVQNQIIESNKLSDYEKLSVAFMLIKSTGKIIKFTHTDIADYLGRKHTRGINRMIQAIQGKDKDFPIEMVTTPKKKTAYNLDTIKSICGEINTIDTQVQTNLPFPQ